MDLFIHVWSDLHTPSNKNGWWDWNDFQSRHPLIENPCRIDKGIRWCSERCSHPLSYEGCWDHNEGCSWLRASVKPCPLQLRDSAGFTPDFHFIPRRKCWVTSSGQIYSVLWWQYTMFFGVSQFIGVKRIGEAAFRSLIADSRGALRQFFH
jgi:hypothetical protein